MSLASNGTISASKALALASSELESIFGIKHSMDLVAYNGGEYAEFATKVAGVIRPELGYVDIF